MKSASNVVSIHPYFKVHPGKLDAFKALLPAFIARTATEPACLYYDFTISDDIVHCREAYAGAAGALEHIENVGSLLDEALKLADLMRLEFHGRASELDQLRGPMGGLNPTWFVYQAGLDR